MPKSADAQPELALQGSLFGEPEPAQPAPAPPEATAEGLSDAELGADAAARPRQAKRHKSDELEPENNADPAEHDRAEQNHGDDDLPAWAHHSQLQPEQLTPVLRHYVELKRAHPERVLLYRLGDFFECFFEDAITLSRELELTLTGKDAGKTIGRVPMAGIPHHAAERYCSDLIRLGYSVASAISWKQRPPKDRCSSGTSPACSPPVRCSRKACSVPGATTGWLRWW